MTRLARPPQRANGRNESEGGTPPLGPFAQAVGRSRLIVTLAVIAVMVIAVALFLLGTGLAIVGVWHAFRGVLRGELGSTDLTVEFLEVVSVMLKAVVFYLIGVGLYSLFIAPLNLTAALGVETLSDLEGKVVSVIIVIMSVTFLEHFIRWENPVETLQFGGALGVVVVALVLFQYTSHHAKEEQRKHDPDTQVRAQRELFQRDHERREVLPDEERGAAPTTDSH